MKLGEKKIIIIGDRDGVHGEEIEDALKRMGYKPVFSCTECFVCTAAGSVDFPNQQKIKELAQTGRPEDFAVLLGVADSEGAEVHARTVTTGDPSCSGVLSGVELHLPVYHVFEPEVKNQVDKSVYDETIGVVEQSLNKKIVDDTIATVRRIREEGSAK